MLVEYLVKYKYSLKHLRPNKSHIYLYMKHNVMEQNALRRIKKINIKNAPYLKQI